MTSNRRPEEVASKRAASGRPRTHDEFLARLPAPQRTALEHLRRKIRAAAPEAEECISYGIPAFRRAGRFFVGYGAGKNHCSFYPGSVPKLAKAELDGAVMAGKGTLHFSPENPLSDALVRRIISLRKKQAIART